MTVLAIRQLPSGAFQASLWLYGQQYAETFLTRKEAEDWQTLTEAKAISGMFSRPSLSKAFFGRFQTWLMDCIGRHSRV